MLTTLLAGENQTMPVVWLTLSVVQVFCLSPRRISVVYPALGGKRP